MPGVQCQVDPGELRNVLIGGEERTLYFVVFVLSCLRLMYVGVAFQPLATESFIRLHDEAFRYFGGVTEACVYDQTKMVVSSTGSSLVNGISYRKQAVKRLLVFLVNFNKIRLTFRNKPIPLLGSVFCHL